MVENDVPRDEPINQIDPYKMNNTLTGYATTPENEDGNGFAAV